MRSASRPSFPGQPVSISKDRLAGVTNRVACPPSTSTKNIRNALLSSAAGEACAGKNSMSTKIELKNEITVRVRRKGNLRSMGNTLDQNEEHRDHPARGTHGQEKTIMRLRLPIHFAL